MSQKVVSSSESKIQLLLKNYIDNDWYTNCIGGNDALGFDESQFCTQLPLVLSLNLASGWESV